MGTIATVSVVIAIVAVVVVAAVILAKRRKERGQDYDVPCPFRTFDDCTREQQFHDDETDKR